MPKAPWLTARGIETDWPVAGLPDIRSLSGCELFHATSLWLTWILQARR